MHLETENTQIVTPRLVLRSPRYADFEAWRTLRYESCRFLMPWEPAWASDQLDHDTFVDRVTKDNREAEAGRALPMVLICKANESLLGEVALNNIRRGPYCDGNLGFWIAEKYARNGFMREALPAIIQYAFQTLDISRVQAACLSENIASKGLLEKSGFAHEGVARSYMQIAGKWRDHEVFATLRRDRRRRGGT